MKLVAVYPILYGARQYEVGDELPDSEMKQTWLDAGTSEALLDTNRFLLENGCDKLQGYLIGRPLDEETAIALLEKERPGGIALAGPETF